MSDNLFRQAVDANLRLRMLTWLEMSGAMSMYAESLYNMLNDYKHNVAHEDVMRNLLWLKEQKLIEIEDIAGARLAKLTQRGLDVQAGRLRMAGVARPGPED